MASAFKPVPQPGSPQPRVQLFVPETATGFIEGDLVYLDTNDNLVKVCGADPALILGRANGASADRSLWGGLVPVAIIESAQTWLMASSTTPADSHLTDAYGIEKTGNNWRVDTGDTSNTRVDVVQISPKSGFQGQEGFLVKFKAANLQGDGIAS